MASYWKDILKEIEQYFAAPFLHEGIPWQRADNVDHFRKDYFNNVILLTGTSEEIEYFILLPKAKVNPSEGEPPPGVNRDFSGSTYVMAAILRQEEGGSQFTSAHSDVFLMTDELKGRLWNDLQNGERIIEGPEDESLGDEIESPKEIFTSRITTLETS